MEQAKPLAPAASYFRSDHYQGEALSTELKLHQQRHRKCIKCCGCVTAIFLILAVVILVLTFTVFHVKNPKIKMNQVTFQLPEFANGTPRQDVNVTFVADVSVKNPNVASFKFNNGTTTIYYGGTVVGEGRTPPGKAKARRTLHMNVTVVIVPEKLFAVPRFGSDLSSGSITMSSNTIISGKVKIIEIFKKHVVVKTNCTMTYNFTSRAIQDQICRPTIFI